MYPLESDSEQELKRLTFKKQKTVFKYHDACRKEMCSLTIGVIGIKNRIYGRKTITERKEYADFK